MIKKLKNLLIEHFGIIVGFIYVNLVYLSFHTPGGDNHIILRYFRFSLFKDIANDEYIFYIVKSMFLGFILGLPAGIAASRITKKLTKSGKKP